MEPKETKTVTTTTVACDGGESGHPRVFLNMGDDGYVDCPYCGCRYILDSDAPATAAH